MDVDTASGGSLLTRFETCLRWFNNKLDSFGGETRGIHRILPEERTQVTFMNVIKLIFLWMGGACGLSSASGFFLGPIVFGLGFKDSMTAGIFGLTLGCITAAYASIMGPRSGLRQMALSRFVFGWWPTKAIALLNVITLLGYAVVNSVTGGQILASVSNSKIPLEVGIVIIAVISVVIGIFGITYVMAFEGYASIPVFIGFLLLYICSSEYFNTDLQTSSSFTPVTARGNWLSFFSVCYGITASWAGVTSDYFIEFPETMSLWASGLLTFICILIPTTFVGVVSILVATGAMTHANLMDGYNAYGNGGLLNAAFAKWHGGGKFLLIMLFISLVSNNIINVYSISLSSQIWWGKNFNRVPRWSLVLLSAIIYFVCAIAGRDKLAPILNNFLPIIGYWCIIYITILLEENLIFRRRKLQPREVGNDDSGLGSGQAKDFEEKEVASGGHAELNEAGQPLGYVAPRADVYRWADWDTPSRLPVGGAATAAFLIGVAGAVLGMCQVYYIGPIARRVGEYGGDLGMWCSSGFAGVTYPILRYLELEYAPWSDKYLMQ